MYKVNPLIEPHYPVRARLLKKAALACLDKLNIKGSAEVNIAVIGDRKMRQLNRDFRGIDKPTDVLSFSLTEKRPWGKEKKDDKGILGMIGEEEKVLFLGDIAISYPQVLNRAMKENKLVDEIVSHLVVHGILHLCGYDHAESSDARKMEALEREILAELK